MSPRQTVAPAVPGATIRPDSVPDPGANPVLPEAMATAVQAFPCTSAQQQFWLLDRLDPGDPALNVAVRWLLEGEVSSGLLERSLQAVIARHETLRTGFAETEAGLVQRVLPDAPFRLGEADLSGLPDPEAEAERLARREARLRFDLAGPPLLRATLLRLGARRHHLVVTVHHIVSDGWSIGLLASEVAAFYEALRSSGPAPGPLPLHYGDYARWQEAWLASPAPREAEAYWTRRLAGASRFEVLPDRTRPAVATSNGHIVSTVLPWPLTEALKALAIRRQATLFMLFHAAMAAVLARWTGEDDIILGTQVANRDEPELEALVGVFINTLVLRTDLGDDPEFFELLSRCRRTVLEALDHRHLPAERVVELLRPARDASRRHPLFSVNIILHRDFIAPAATGDFRLSSIPSVSPGAIYDLNVFMVVAEDLRAPFDVSSDAAFARTMAVAQREAPRQAALARAALDAPFVAAWFGAAALPIGILGGSFGGAVAVAAARAEPRIRAVVNFDGWVFGDAYAAPFPAPYLLFGADERDLVAEAPRDALEARRAAMDRRERPGLLRQFRAHGGSLIVLRGAEHADFFDEPLRGPPGLLRAGGRIAPDRAQAILRAAVRGFLEAALLGGPPAFGPAMRAAYPELRIVLPDP